MTSKTTINQLRWLAATLMLVAAMVMPSTAWAQSTYTDDFVGGRTDFRDESIYFVLTTRFYDGDKSNNAYCWDHEQARNGMDAEWRGDFKGLIEKLDYIKALGFTAVWISPVAENGSGYDYHGYHPIDFSKEDIRLQSKANAMLGIAKDVTFQTLVDEAHKRGMKIILDIVLNSTCNFGEANLCQLFGVYNMDKADSPLNAASIIIGLGAIFVLTAILYLRKVKLTKENIITVSVFLIGICPFFLPHMHERYFYAVDVLVLVYALINKRRYFLIPLMQVSSGIAYYHYLTGFKKYFIDILGEDSVSFAAWINLFVLMVIFYDIMKLDHVDYHDSIDEIEEEKRKIKEGEEDISSTLTNGL